jgi:putative ABC transport system permease protein
MAGMASSLLVSMLILGLMGVLWQNITRRTKEIGLRRANGATRGQIFGQIIGEMLFLATAGIVPGILIIVQLLFLDSFGYISHTIHIVAMTVSALVLYCMVAACSLYPGYMATRVSPAEALHCE